MPYRPVPLPSATLPVASVPIKFPSMVMLPKIAAIPSVELPEMTLPARDRAADGVVGTAIINTEGGVGEGRRARGVGANKVSFDEVSRRPGLVRDIVGDAAVAAGIAGNNVAVRGRSSPRLYYWTKKSVFRCSCLRPCCRWDRYR